MSKAHRKWTPSELVRYFESPFASWMDRWYREVANGIPATFVFGNTIIEDCQPDGPDEELEILAEKGYEHEKDILDSLIAQGKSVVTCERGRDNLSQFRQAMEKGIDVIYQPLLMDDQFLGYADFLVRVEDEGAQSGYSYEVWDSKLARSPRPGFVLQLCLYSEILGGIQGRLPSNFVLALGNGEKRSYPLRSFYYLYRHMKNEFIDFQSSFAPSRPPHPADSSSLGCWSGVGQKILDVTDHLSLVAGITRGQIGKLEGSEIHTVAELAETDRKYVKGMAPDILEKLKEQADLQIRSRGLESPLFRVIRPQENDQRRGLALLPPSAELDVFFDIEGYPHMEGGLEYLLGAVTNENGKPVFCDWWAHDHDQEKKSFEQFIDWIYDRWKRDPNMHIYHYAPYETTAMKRLMGTYATREDEVDDLLRNHVFVDLYMVVRQGLRLGTPSYSLKEVEHLYRPRREGDVVNAGASVVAYHKWIQSGEAESWQDSPILKEIRDYNEVDCVSTWELANWLWEKQEEEGIPWISPFDDASENEEIEADTGVPSEFEIRRQERKELARNLCLRGDAAEGEQGRIDTLMGHLTEFHSREAKPVFWKKYDRAEKTDMELYDDPDCLAMLRRTNDPPRPEKRSLVYTYSFDPNQETKIKEGSSCYLNDLSCKYGLFHMDPGEGIAEIKIGKHKQAPRDFMTLIPDEYVPADVIEDKLFEIGERSISGEGLTPAQEDIMNRKVPRLKGDKEAFIYKPEDGLEGISEIARSLDSSVLCIQGPPGAGKTYTGGHLIADLLCEGKRIGITATGHKTILNLMDSVNKVLTEKGRPFPLFKVGGPDDDLFQNANVYYLRSGRDIQKCFEQTQAFVVGATAWGLSRSEMRSTLDYLFIDEAGQFSLANSLAASDSAENIVLLGDQMQLSQPIQGSHPGESGDSCLEYLLEGRATIPANRGVFLGQTWRMHPNVCSFISEAFYDGRLHSIKGLEKQKVISVPEDGFVQKESGLFFIPVDHDGNGQASDEEVEVIAEITKELVGGIYIDEQGSNHILSKDDILYVAPYNMQVRNLKRKLGEDARVGSVDLFQGQEAPVVILSMCSSSRDESSRGMDFLCDPHRINVAISRAKALAIVVGSPKLLQGGFSSLKEMELANLYAWMMNMKNDVLNNIMFKNSDY